MCLPLIECVFDKSPQSMTGNHTSTELIRIEKKIVRKSKTKTLTHFPQQKKGEHRKLLTKKTPKPIRIYPLTAKTYEDDKYFFMNFSYFLT